MYKVLKMFTDLQDNGHKYLAGDTFPREGLSVSAKRLDELASDKNRRGVALIEYVEEAKAEPAEDFMNKPVSDEKPKRKRKQKNVE